MSLEPRFVLFHKQATSARTRFLRFPHGLLAFSPLPAGTTLSPAGVDGDIRLHPAAPLREAEIRFGLEPGCIVAEPEFHAEASTAEGVVPILLAGFTTIDPPFAAAAHLGGRFIAITEARDLSGLELELVRRAYEAILG